MSRSPYGDPRYPTPPPPGAPGPYPPPGGPYQPPTYAPPPYPPGSYAPEGYPPGAYPPGASPPGGYPPGAPPPPADAAPPPAATPTPPAAAPPSTGRGRRSERDRGGVVAGIVVVGIGLFLLAAQVVPDIGQWIPLAIGLVFLAAFVSRREYGFLIPGSILAGIGVGVVLANVLEGSLAGPAVVLSLAGGFAAIWVVSSITGIGPVSRSADGTEAPSATWWPLIPGGILGLIGAVLLADADAGGILRWWPIAIVALGIVILARALLERRSRS